MSKMLFPKMAVSNIRKNKKLYVPYIITAIFTVMMFFMNISIVKNKNVAAMRGGQNVVLLLQVALVVSFIFSAIFLFYTNSFLMKRRTKEIGLYNILGMEKKHISLMMLFENVIITIISLTAGIVFGIIFSRLVFLVLMKLIKWTKHSVSMPQCLVMCSTSGRLSSRASTTRAKPSSFSSSAPCRVWTLIWVEPCRGSCGAILPIKVATARS